MSVRQLDTVLRFAQRARVPTGADPDLLAQFATSGDEAAFAVLVARHHPMVLGVCRRVLHHTQDAEDACQATFLALARQAKAVRRGEAMAGWLYHVARRIALKARTKAMRRAARSEEIPPPSEAAPDVTWREGLAILDEELSRIPAAYRAALVLCYLEGKTQDEAARQLGWTLGVLRGQLERGREKLRARLLRRGVSLTALLGLILSQQTIAGPAASSVAQAALHSAVPTHVAALAEQGTKVLASAKAKLGAALILTIGVFSATFQVTAQPGGGPAGGPPPAPVAMADAVADPLPAGAVLRLGNTWLRHANVFSLAFTADGNLASIGGDYTVRTWDPAYGRPVRDQAIEKETMHRHWRGCFSPDGRRIAVQRINKLKVFDTASGKELASALLASSYEMRCAFSPDGKQFAFADQDGKFNTTRLQMMDVDANTTRDFCEINSFASAPVFSRDGKRLALAQGDPDGVAVWDVATGKELLRFRPAKMLGGTVDFDPTGDVLAVLGAINPPQQIHYVRVSTGQPVEGWTVPLVDSYEWVQFSPDSKSILFGGRKGIQWCDPKTGEVQHLANDWAATPPAFSPDGKLVAVGGENSVRLFDVSRGPKAIEEKWEGPARSEVQGVAVSPDGRWFLTRDFNGGTIDVWDNSGRRVKGIPTSHTAGRYPLFSPDGRHLFGGASDAVALVRWDFPVGKEAARYTFEALAKNHVSIYHFGLSADGKRLAALTPAAGPVGGAGGPGPGGPGGEPRVLVTVWDVATAERLVSRVVPLGKAFYGYGAFTPDLRYYVSGDQAIPVDGGSDLRLDLPEGWTSPRQTAVSPDGRLAAQMIAEPTGQGNQIDWKRIAINEVATGKSVALLPAGFCGPMAFTPDGRGLITTDPDAITLWDLATQKPVVRHSAPGQFISRFGNSFASSLVLTADGKRALTGHRDTTALLWDMKRPARPTGKLTEREVAAAWAALAGDDAPKAYTAIWALVDAPSVAVPYLRTRVKPVTGPTAEQAAALIARLDAPAFAAREAAEKELRAHGDAAVPALRSALGARPTGEQAIRLERLLTAATQAVPTSDTLRTLRAIAVLELAGTLEARALLKELSGALAGTRVTTEAREAVGRGSRRE